MTLLMSGMTYEPKIKNFEDISSESVLTMIREVIKELEPFRIGNCLRSALELTSIKITDMEGTTDTKLEKGQKFKVIVEYGNIADQTDLEGVNVKVTVYEGDSSDLKTIVTNIDGDDLEDEDDSSDLSNGKTATASFEFEMPYDMEDKDDFTVFAEITADAEDTSSNFYATDTKEFTSVVPEDKLEILKATITPSTLVCGANKARVTVELKNIGSNSQDVQLFLRNQATAFDKQLNDGDELEVDNDFSDEDTFSVSIDEYVTFTDIKEGANTYTVIAYYNDGDANVQKDIVVTQQSCTPVPTTPAETTATTPTTPAKEEVIVDVAPVAPVVNPSYITLKDVSGIGLDSDLILPVAIGVGGLIVGLIVALLLIPRP